MAKRIRIARTKTKPRKKARGNGKGPAFERLVCKRLSLWVSKGRRTDLFWRTAMSGGRATVARRQGVVVRQGGDICAVSPDGHTLTDHWHIECKFYRNINFAGWVITGANSKLQAWWHKCKTEARQQGKEPMLIAKQNGWPVLVITKQGALEHWTACQCHLENRFCDVSFFDDMVRAPYK